VHARGGCFGELQSVTSLVVKSLASHALDQIAAIGQGRAKPSAGA
jgi:hypothetical protein